MPIIGKFRPKDKSSASLAMEQKLNESPLEAEARKEGNFAEIESLLPKRFGRTEMGLIDKGTGMHFTSQNSKNTKKTY